MNRKKTLGIVSAFLGVAALCYVFSPLVVYELTTGQKLANYLSPVPDNKVDYTKASNWIPGSNIEEFKAPKVSFYSLSVPRLNIEKATVSIGGEDLSQSLIQYPGTALPGKIGNAVVFGHSILPQFYNPKNYMSIFSTIDKLEEGDDIKIAYDGVSYTYEVSNIFEVLPTDIRILEQNTDDSYLTLVTCSPPGNPLRPKRLIVRARIVPYDKVALENDYSRD